VVAERSAEAMTPPAKSLVLVAPQGYRVEGLDLGMMAVLLECAPIGTGGRSAPRSQVQAVTSTAASVGPLRFSSRAPWRS
jgi:hypothetical protein